MCDFWSSSKEMLAGGVKHLFQFSAVDLPGQHQIKRQFIIPLKVARNALSVFHEDRHILCKLSASAE